MVSGFNVAGSLATNWGLPLVRVRPGRVFEFNSISEDVALLCTHWLGGSSVLCAHDGGECKACHISPRRSLGYHIVSVPRDGRDYPALLECPSSCADALSDGVRESGIGCKWEAYRRSSKSPIVVTHREGTGLYASGFEGIFRLCAAIATLYRLPLPVRCGEVVETWREKSLEARRLVIASRLPEPE